MHSILGHLQKKKYNFLFPIYIIRIVGHHELSGTNGTHHEQHQHCGHFEAENSPKMQIGKPRLPPSYITARARWLGFIPLVVSARSSPMAFRNRKAEVPVSIPDRPYTLFLRNHVGSSEKSAARITKETKTRKFAL